MKITTHTLNIADRKSEMSELMHILMVQQLRKQKHKNKNNLHFQY